MFCGDREICFRPIAISPEDMARACELCQYRVRSAVAAVYFVSATCAKFCVVRFSIPSRDNVSVRIFEFGTAVPSVAWAAG